MIRYREYGRSLAVKRSEKLGSLGVILLVGGWGIVAAECEHPHWSLVLTDFPLILAGMARGMVVGVLDILVALEEAMAKYAIVVRESVG